MSRMQKFTLIVGLILVTAGVLSAFTPQLKLTKKLAVGIRTFAGLVTFKNTNTTQNILTTQDSSGSTATALGPYGTLKMRVYTADPCSTVGKGTMFLLSTYKCGFCDASTDCKHCDDSSSDCAF